MTTHSHTFSKNHIPQTHINAHTCNSFRTNIYTYYLKFLCGERKDAVLLLPMRCAMPLRSCFTYVHVFIFLQRAFTHNIRNSISDNQLYRLIFSYYLEHLNSQCNYLWKNPLFRNLISSIFSE